MTAWNYGDPVPGVEQPPAFDKPKKKAPCRLKDTGCLDPLNAGDEPLSSEKGTTMLNPWSQEIEQKVEGGLLSSEQIRQEIEQKVRGGPSATKISAVLTTNRAGRAPTRTCLPSWMEIWTGLKTAKPAPRTGLCRERVLRRAKAAHRPIRRRC